MAAQNVSVIGRTTRVRGRVSGNIELEVQGFVDGEIAVSGDVTVDTHGIIGAGVRGRRLVVRGAVKGDLIGEEAVSLEEGARVVGDIRAPRVAIAPGALVRGFVQTGEAQATQARAGRQQVTGRPQGSARAPTGASSIAGSALSAKASARTSPSSEVAPRAPAARSPTKPGAGAVAATNSASAQASPRRPPPPVVPALKKVKGQIARRRER